MEVDEEKVNTYNISVGVCLWSCRLYIDVHGQEAWMQWSCIDVIVLGFKSVEEMYCILLPHWKLTVRTLAKTQGEEFAWTIPILPSYLWYTDLGLQLSN